MKWIRNWTVVLKLCCSSTSCIFTLLFGPTLSGCLWHYLEFLMHMLAVTENSPQRWNCLLNAVVFIVALSLIIPSAMILFYLGHTDAQTKSLSRKIISSVTSLPTCLPEKEELLILLLHCKFASESFRAFDTSFATVGRVSFPE